MRPKYRHNIQFFLISFSLLFFISFQLLYQGILDAVIMLFYLFQEENILGYCDHSLNFCHKYYRCTDPGSCFGFGASPIGILRFLVT